MTSAASKIRLKFALLRSWGVGGGVRAGGSPIRQYRPYPWKGAVTGPKPRREGDVLMAATALPWTRFLAQPHPTRAALGEIAAYCLWQETKKHYAVYLPCSSSSSDVEGESTPGHFLSLLQTLSRAGLGDEYGRKVGALFVELLRKPIHPQYGVLSSWDLPKEEVTRLKGVAIREVMGSVAEPRTGLEWLAKVLGMESRTAPLDECGGVCPIKPADIALASVMERLAQIGHPLSVQLQHTQDEAVLTSAEVIGAVASSLIRCADVSSKQKALKLLEKAVLAQLHTPSTSPFIEEVVVHCAETAAVAGNAEMVTRLMFLLYRFKGALASQEAAGPAKGRCKGGAAPLSLSQALWRLCGRVSLPRRRAPEFGMAVSEGRSYGDADLSFEKSALRLLKSVVRAVLYAAPAGPSKGGGSGEQSNGASPLSSLDEALGLFRSLKSTTSWAGVAGMAVELLRYTAATQQRWAGREVSSAQTALLGQHALEVLGVVLRAFPKSGAVGVRESAPQEVLTTCAELCLQTCVPLVAAMLREPWGVQRVGAAAPFASFLSTVGDQAILEVFRVIPRTGQARLLPYALCAAIELLAKVASGETVGGHSLACLGDYFSAARTPMGYLAGGGDSRVDELSGSLLLFLSFMLSPGHADHSLTAGFVSQLCEDRCTLERIRQVQQDWLKQSSGAQRRGLWHILHYSYHYRLRSREIDHRSSPAVLTTTQMSHLHQAIKANTQLMCELATNNTPWRSQECAELSCVLYNYGISPSQFTDVNDLLSHLMGFTVEATSLTRIVEGLSRMSHGAGLTTHSPTHKHADAIVVISVGTLTKLDNTHPTEEEEEQPQLFETFANQTLCSLLPSSCKSFHVTFILTYEGLVYLKKSIGDGSTDGSKSFSRALLKKLRRLSETSTNVSTIPRDEYGLYVAAPHTLPRGYRPYISTVDGELSYVDGLDEACFLAHTLLSTPQLSSANCVREVFYWNEDDEAMRDEAQNMRQFLEANRVHVLSVRRAQIKKAKNVIFQLLQDPPTPSHSEKLTEMQIRRFTRSAKERTLYDLDDTKGTVGSDSKAEKSGTKRECQREW